MTTLHGTDLSSYQRGINVAKLGVDFIIAKATQGTNYVNPYCDGFISQATKAGMLTGAYHFAAGGSAVAEADYFVKNIKGYIGKSLLALDFETANLINHNNVQWAHLWLNRVHTLTGVRPLLYMPGWVYNAYDWSAVAKDDYGVWVAYWPTRPARYTYGSPEKLRYWSTTALWQFSDSGNLPGWAGKLDLDVFFGDRNAWKAYAAVGGAKPAPVVPKIVNINEIRVAVKKINGMSQPTGHSTVLKTARKGERLHLIHSTIDTKGHVWLQGPAGVWWMQSETVAPPKPKH